MEIDCGLPVEAYLKRNKCKKIVTKQLPCGHTIETECHKIPEGCSIKVIKRMPCDHEQKMRCDENPKEYFSKNGCKVPCNAILECGHECPNNCG